MTAKTTTLTFVLILTMTGGCASTGNLPLLFGQSHVVGLSMGASTTEQGADLTLGYKDRDLASVPVDPQATAGGENADALSTLGQFDLNAEAGAGQTALGKFFATGMAARILAEGFRCSISEGQHVSCQQPPAAE